MTKGRGRGRDRGPGISPILLCGRASALALVAVTLAGLAGAGAGRVPPGPLNLVLISLDTLRADHVGAFGYDQPTTPRLDAFLRRATLFRRAVAQAPSTIPSHASLLTSLDASAVTTGKQLREDATTLAEQLGEAGFATWGFVDGGNMSRPFGFAQGFDHYEDQRIGAAALAGRALAWLDEHPAEPFFLFVHTYEIHTPYTGDPRYTALFGEPGRLDTTPLGARYFHALERRGTPVAAADLREFVARYDAGIRKADDAIGEFLEGLERQGLLERTLVVLLADHGEEFLEHGRFGHVQLFLDPNLRVPLAFRVPGVAARRIDQTVELTDVVPTVRALLGLVPLAGLVGRDLSGAILRGAALDPEHAAYAQLGQARGAHTVVRGRYQLMVERRTGTARLYDLAADPRGARDIAAARPELVAALRPLLERRLAIADARTRGGVATGPRLDAGLRHDLEVLGYIEE